MQLLFEEFGKWLNATANAGMVERDAAFTTVFDASEAIMDQPGTALKGLGKAFIYVFALHKSLSCVVMHLLR